MTRLPIRPSRPSRAIARRSRLLACAAVAWLAPAALLAQATPAPVAAPDTAGDAERAPLTAPMPTDPAVRTGMLPNGLRYWIRANEEPANRAELRLVVNAGSVLEASTQRGLAHLVEHMAFNGTRRFPKQKIVSYLESVGMRFGPDVNAYTSFDETVYMLTLPTDTASVMETGLDILVDWASGITFDSAQLAQERPVVIEEWRLGQGADARMRDQQLPVVFQGSRYASRLPIGDTAVVRHAPRSELVRYYEDWYRPALMSVVVVGDVDPARMEQMVRTRFGALRNPANPRLRPVVPMPGHAETLVAIATDPEATVSAVQVLWKHAPPPDGTVGDYRAQLVRGLSEGMLNGRLGELAQQPAAPFVYAYAGDQQLVRVRDAFVMGGPAKEGALLPTLATLLTEARRVDEFGYTATELEREKADLLRAYERGFAEREKTPSARYADEYVRAALTGEPIAGIGFEYGLARRFLPDIALNEVNLVVRQQVTDSNRVLLVNAPRKEAARVPSEPELLAVFDSVRAATITPYVDDVATTPLVEHPPEPGRVVTATPMPAVEATLWTLSNGVRVIVKPTNFRADQVLLESYSPGGSSLAPDSLWIAASTASTVVGIGGVGTMDAVQLQKALAGKAAGAGASIGTLEESVSGSGSPKDLETLFQLVYLRFTAPRADSAAFTAFRSRMGALLENRSREPEAIFADTLQVTLAQHHPRARPISVAWLDSLDLGKSMHVYRDRFANAGDFTFVLVGAVDTATARPLVERWLGGLPAIDRPERGRDIGIRPPSGVVERTVYAGQEARGTTQLVFTGPFEYTRENREALSALADVLDMRLREVLREAMGGTYGVEVGANSQREPRAEYSVGIGFSAAPERVAELTSAVFAQIDSLQRTGPTADELAKVKEIRRRALQTSLTQNGWWTGQLVFHDRNGWDPALILQQDALAAATTPETVRTAAQRWLDRERYVQVTLLPAR